MEKVPASYLLWIWDKNEDKWNGEGIMSQNIYDVMVYIDDNIDIIENEAKKIKIMEYKETDWVNYRPLEKGEIIKYGDEILHDKKGWHAVKIRTIGTRAPDPRFTSHRQFRRPIKKS